ncbi:hypothetical protein MASR1M6_26970 [Rubrivivax sp.]
MLSTLHTNDAASAVIRLVDMGVERFLITSTVNGVVAQRLVRTLCSQCKAPEAPDPAWLQRQPAPAPGTPARRSTSRAAARPAAAPGIAAGWASTS